MTIIRTRKDMSYIDRLFFLTELYLAIASSKIKKKKMLCIFGIAYLVTCPSSRNYFDSMNPKNTWYLSIINFDEEFFFFFDGDHFGGL